LKLCVFGVTAVNSGATTFFFYYLYFHTRQRFGFGETQNLLLAAALGYIYAGSSYLAGNFAQRFGNFFSIRFGMVTMVAAMTAASFASGLWVFLALIAVTNFGMCFCWPALEGLMSVGEPPARLQSLVGMYSISWATAGAVAYFTGGALLEHLGESALYYAPVATIIAELIFLSWFERAVARQRGPRPDLAHSALEVIAEGDASPIPAKTFLQMGWLANPMAYLVVNTVVSTIPSLAERFGFEKMTAGFVCSVWLFSRAASFVALRMWPRWHYRFRFLAFGYVAMILSFAVMLIIPNVWTLVVSQLVLGAALGLMYYSSLFYSMDVGETKSEHGGIHEAAIGLGSGSGPAIAAGSVALFPASPASGPIGVSVLLLGGFAALMRLRFRTTNGDAKGGDLKPRRDTEAHG